MSTVDDLKNHVESLESRFNSLVRMCETIQIAVAEVDEKLMRLEADLQDVREGSL